MPTWGGGGSLNDIDFDDIYYYIKPMEGQAKDWDMVPDSIKATYEKLGIPQAERKYLAGVTAQYESEVVYHRNREDLEGLGVLFCDMDTALREYPEIVQKYFGTIIPPNDNKFAASTQQCGRAARSSTFPGRPRRSAVAGVLPHQRREHGPVRAHPDHRGRRRLTAITSRAALRRRTPATRCTLRSSRSW